MPPTSPASGINDEELFNQITECFDRFGHDVIAFGKEEGARAILAQKYIKYIMLLMEITRENQVLEDFLSLTIHLSGVDESVLVKWRNEQLASLKK